MVGFQPESALFAQMLSSSQASVSSPACCIRFGGIEKAGAAGHHGTQALENPYMSLECVTLSSGAHTCVVDVCCPCPQHPSPTMPLLKFVLKCILSFLSLFLVCY